MEASPDEWTGGTVRPAKPLRRTNYQGAGSPPRFTLIPGRGAVVPNDIGARYVPPDCDLSLIDTYDLGAEEPKTRKLPPRPVGAEPMSWRTWAGVIAAILGVPALLKLIGVW